MELEWEMHEMGMIFCFFILFYGFVCMLLVFFCIFTDPYLRTRNCQSAALQLALDLALNSVAVNFVVAILIVYARLSVPKDIRY